jgi:aminoglycoside 3-N-acetyltransferase
VVSSRDFSAALRGLEINPSRPVIAHASLSAFGQVQGGAPAVVGALLATFTTVVMPAFTYGTMVIPQAGPANNGIEYGRGQYTNRRAVFFNPDMPVDRMIGAIPETLRRHPQACRSSHPILSFTGVQAGPFLDAQTIAEPLAPIRMLVEAQGWVLLLGVQHTANTSIHYAERLAGRRQFIRWALTPEGAVECPGFPGCSSGFQALAPRLEGVVRAARAGEGQVQAVALEDLIREASAWVRGDPLALLCDRPECERCGAMRAK